MVNDDEAFRAQATTFAARFAALGHVNRVEILRHLLTAHPTGLVVGEIQERLGIPASTLSHHLEALRQEGLVTQAREGRYLRYRAGTDALNALLGFLYAECCAGGATPAGARVATNDSMKIESEVDASNVPAVIEDKDAMDGTGNEGAVEKEGWQTW